jgi:hypothetical protein
LRNAARGVATGGAEREWFNGRKMNIWWRTMRFGQKAVIKRLSEDDEIAMEAEET